MSYEMLEQLEYILPIFSASNLLFSIIMKGGSTPLFSFIGLAIGVIHAFLPMGDFNEYVCRITKAQPNE